MFSFFPSPQAKTPWLSRALHCIGKAILADKAEAASRHYEQQQLQDGGLIGEGGSRRRSSAVRAVALFQKFKDYNEGGDGEGFFIYFCLCVTYFIWFFFISLE